MKSETIGNISEILEGFELHNPAENNSPDRNSRQEYKFVLTIKQLPEVLAKLRNDYQILVPDNKRLLEHECVYFDTKDYDFYKQHHNGKINRYKVRFRRYLDSNTCDFEIKVNSNRSMPYKIKVGHNKKKYKIKGKKKDLVKKYTGIKAKKLVPKLTVNYNRICFSNNTLPEKITFDMDFRFANESIEKIMDGIVLLKLEKHNLSKDSELLDFLKTSNIHSMNLSKYCTGIALTNKNVKHNRFKYKLQFINKLLNGTNGR